MSQKLFEATKAATRDGLKARLRLITEGQGSSAFYPGDVLRRDGATAFPKGTHVYVNHLGESEFYERGGSRNTNDLIGITLEDAAFDETERALFAETKFYESKREFIEDVWEDVGMSIEAEGAVVDGTLANFIPSVFNAVALVPRAGAGGRIEALVESARENYGKLSDNGDKATEPGEDTGTHMTPDDIQKIAESVREAISPLFDTLTESLKPAVVESAVEETAPDTSAVVEALVAANLPESARKRVYEGMKADGAEVTALVEAEKKYIAELLEESKTATDNESVGRVQESGTTAHTTRPSWG